MRQILTVLGFAALLFGASVPTAAVVPPIEAMWNHVDSDPMTDKRVYSLTMGPHGRLYTVTTIDDGTPEYLCVVRKHSLGGAVDWEYTTPGFCWDIAADWAGNVVVVGNLYVQGQLLQNHAFKLSDGGGLIFDQVWGGSSTDKLYSVRITPTSQILVTGATFAGSSWDLGQLHKLDGQTGALDWTHTDVQVPDDNTIIGYPVSDAYGNVYFRVDYGNSDQSLKALDKDGYPLWSVPTAEYAWELRIGPGGSILYGADTTGSIGTYEFVATAWDTGDGSQLWSNSVPGTAGICGQSPDIARDGMGNIYVAGGCDGPQGVSGLTLAKYDWSGALQWTREWFDPTAGDPNHGYAVPSGIAIDPAGQVVLGVKMSTGAATIGYSPDGTVVWEKWVNSVGRFTEMAVNSLGYPALSLHDRENSVTRVWMFGSPRDWWEVDNNWILAHPWVHPAGPPQFHNFFDDVDDWVSFHARAGQTYRISATATGTALPGVQLQLYSTNGQTLLGSALPAGFGTNPLTELVWTAPAGGSYHVHLSPTDATAGVDREYNVTISGEQGPSHLWSRQYGAYNVADDISDVVQGPDGSYFVVGDHPVGDDGVGLHHFSKEGLLLSSNQYGGALSDHGRAVAISPVGNPVVAAASSSFSSTDDVLLMELEAAGGPPLTVRRYDSGQYDHVYDLQPDPDGGYYLCGVHGSGLQSFWFMRVDSDGEILWSKTLASDDGTVALCTSMIVGEVLVLTGYVGGGDGLLMAANREDGDLLWAQRYDAESSDIWLGSVVQQGHGDLMVVGTLGSGGSLLAMRTDSIGDPLWSFGYGPGWGRAVVGSVGGSVLVAGESRANDLGDGWLLGLGGDGSVLWERVYGEAGKEGFHAMSLADDGGAIVAGLVKPGSAQKSIDLWTVKTGRLGLLDSGCTLEKPTGSTKTEYAVTASSWAFTESDVAPILTIDDAVAWGTGISATAAEQCGLHEPLALAGTLLFDDHDTMSWSHWTSEDFFTIYRGTDATDTASFSCLACAEVATYDDTDTPASGEVWFYLIAPDNDLGEGPMGTASDGTPRPHPIDCYPPDPF